MRQGLALRPRLNRPLTAAAPASKRRVPIAGSLAAADEELARMAAFKLRETAARLTALARAARSPALSAELLAYVHELMETGAAILPHA